MKIEVSLYFGHKGLNDVLRKFDLFKEGEGMFVKEVMVMTLKKKIPVDKKFKNKIIKGLEKIYADHGFEVQHFEFKILE